MIRFQDFRLTLGIPTLFREWKKLFSPTYLSADLVAGVAVAFIAIPLSLAIALASGVTPGAGLVTAIIAGIVCALFGGTPLSVSGPAAAMAIIVADIVENFGLEGLIAVGLLAGLMQLLSGIFGLGRLARYVPLPVIAGFTAGIGVIILIGQLPRAFGLLPPPESHVFDVIKHIFEYFKEINLRCLSLVVLTIAIIRGLPRLFPKVPPMLPAVAIATAVAYFFHLNVPLIDAIPSSLPAPKWPTMSNMSINEWVLNAFTVYLLASLETLLSSSAVDKLTSDKKHDANQELIGQGLGNVSVALFGGIPITGVIARSVTNIRAGAKTRRSSIIHSLIIILTVYIASPLISLIPIAALAGVLFSVAFSMIDYREFYWLWKTVRSEAVIYALTFFTMIFVDLVAGVQIGMLAAGFIVLLKASKTHLHVLTAAEDHTVRLSLAGSLTFLSTGDLDMLEQKMAKITSGQTLIVDLSGITNMDSSGAAAMVDLYKLCSDRSAKFYIKGLPRRFERLFQSEEGWTIVNDCYLISENELHQKEQHLVPPSARGRLIHGVQRYYAERKYNDKRLFEYLAERQDPHTLFITCADSRIVPSVITSAEPGELFIIRNVGNFIPPYNPAKISSESAGVEFALAHLNISDVVICGHVNCGAINACRQKDDSGLSANLLNWINEIRAQLPLQSNKGVNQLARENVLNQLTNLRTYPIVQTRCAANTLNLHAWFFNFDRGVIYEGDEETRTFHPVVVNLDDAELH